MYFLETEAVTHFNSVDAPPTVTANIFNTLTV